MSKSKSTRSSKVKEDPDAAPKAAKVAAIRKVFFISDRLLEGESSELRLERFYHPGKDRSALFITRKDEEVMEVLEYSEPRRSWLLDNEVCSNGRIYLTTPIDATFFALHHIRKHCVQKALQLDTIRDEKDASTTRLLATFVRPTGLRCIADVKTVGDDMTFYKYNGEKTLAWLAVKTKRLASTLRKTGVHCGTSALSQNYTRSETAAEELVQEIDFLRMACDIIGDYIDLDLHEELRLYLGIPALMQAKVEEKKAAANKRKTVQTLSSSENKKIKLDVDDEGVTNSLKNSSLLDESLGDDSKNIKAAVLKPTPLKERALSAKEKALAKGAKGTKSISSFFKK